jgi:hypothetical protein
MEQEEDGRIQDSSTQSAEFGGVKRKHERDESEFPERDELSPELLQKLNRLLNGLRSFIILTGIAYIVGIVIICGDFLSELAPVYVGYILLVLPLVFWNDIFLPLKGIIGDWEPLRELVRYLRQNFIMMVLHPSQFWFGGGLMAFSVISTGSSIQEDIWELKDTVLRILCLRSQSRTNDSQHGDSGEDCRLTLLEENSLDTDSLASCGE